MKDKPTFTLTSLLHLALATITVSYGVSRRVRCVFDNDKFREAIFLAQQRFSDTLPELKKPQFSISLSDKDGLHHYSLDLTEMMDRLRMSRIIFESSHENAFEARQKHDTRSWTKKALKEYSGGDKRRLQSFNAFVRLLKKEALREAIMEVKLN